MIGNFTYLQFAIFAGSLVISVVLHEMMHAVVAYRLGDDLAHSRGRISFNPLAHIDPFLTIILPIITLLLAGTPILAAKPVPINTSRIRGGADGFALVAIAGPATNFLLALIGGLILRIFGLGEMAQEILLLFIQVNISLCAFNLLPIPPLDGSRVLYAFAPESVRRVMMQFESYGLMGLVMILLVLGPVINPIVGAIYDLIARIVVG